MPHAQTHRFRPLEFYAGMTLGCLQEHPRAGNRACHAPKRTDPVPWSFCEDDVGLPSRTSKGWKSSMPTYRFRPLELFARMTWGCLQEHPKAGNQACYAPKRIDSAPWSFLRGWRWTAFRNLQGLEIEHASRPNTQIPSLGQFLHEWTQTASRTSKGWKSSMPLAETYRFLPLEFFSRMPLGCLQEPPRAGNRLCHAPKRTDSIPWSFLDDDAGLPSSTSKGWKSNMPRNETHRFRRLKFFAGMTLGCLQEGRNSSMPRAKTCRFRPLEFVSGMPLDCL